MGRVARNIAGAFAVADDPEALGPPLLHLLGPLRPAVSDEDQNVTLSHRFLPRLARKSRRSRENAPPRPDRNRSAQSLHLLLVASRMW